MGMALNRAAFMRKARRLVASFIPFVLAVSTLSVFTAAPAQALTNADCTPTVTGLTASAVASGNDCIITITAGSSGTWQVPNGISSVAIVVVGGGAGGGGDGGSGGGGGEIRFNSNQAVTAGQNATITIGAGGAGGSWISGGIEGKNGTATTITGALTYTANGGTGGGGWTSTTGGAGGTGGSGGTGNQGGRGGGGPGDCVGTPSTARIVSSLYFGAVGSNGPSTTVINSSGANYGGGGGGGLGANINNATVSPVENGRGSSGGSGGGGRGSNYRLAVGISNTTIDGASPGESGTANTGGGGGGGSACNAFVSSPQSAYDAANGYQQRTAGGNGGSGVVIVKFTVPTLATPSTPDLDAASDSGPSSTDNATNDTTPTFSGTATPGSSIQLQRDGVNTGSSCLTNSSGNWQCTTGTLSHSGGGNNYRVVATFFGQTTTSGTINVIIRTQTGTFDPTINAGSSANLSSGQTTLIRFGAGAQLYGFELADITVTGGTLSNFTETVANTTWLITFTPTPNASGTAQVSLPANRATDIAGNGNPLSATLSITYDTYGACSPSTTTSGGYTYVAIKDVGTCAWNVPSGVTSIDYLVIAGGGGGGARHAGGGGAGGLLQGTSSLTSVTSLLISVGDGGAGGDTAVSGQNFAFGSAGNSSSVSKKAGTGSFTTLSAVGGGEGKTGGGQAGGNGGSGGGSLGSGGTATSGQGFAGGAGFTNSTSYWGSGGGGGAGAVGATATLNQAGNGGIGTTWSNSGFTTGIASALSLANTSNVYFAGGGGGGATGGTAGTGGTGGGGNGTGGVNTDASAGVTNTGGGGGGGGLGTSVPKGGKGGSGVVLFRYLNAPSISLSTSTISANVDNAVTSYTISNSGGAAASYSISPSLAVSGLSFSTSNGQISGTPTTTASSATYTITATNASGSSTATFTLSSTYSTCSPANASPGTTGYTTLVFTNTTVCNWSVPAGVTTAEVLIVGGGGGGAGVMTDFPNTGGGGGGAGGVFYSNNLSLPSTIQITVGTGGSGGVSGTAREGRNGSKGDSTTFGTIISGGGGGGGCEATGLSQGTTCTTASMQGRNGTAPGSGGGTSNYYNAYNPGGPGIGSGVVFNSVNISAQSVDSSTQVGFSGGYYNQGGSSFNDWGAPGGGARGDANRNTRGVGLTSSISGSSTEYGRGGGAFGVDNWTFSSSTGYGNGGDGQRGSTANGANGGSGVVIVRYANTYTITYSYNSADGGNTTVTSSFTTGGTAITLPVPTRTGYVFGGWYEASDFSGSVLGSTYSPTQTRTIYAKWTAFSTDSTLSALTISTGTLSPTFASATTTYTVSVANGTSSLTVTPTRNQSNATIQVKIGSGSYASVTSGSASASLSLSVGTNAISVQVTAQDGSTTTYTVTVTRLPVVPTITKFDVQVRSANSALVPHKPLTSLLTANYSPTYSKYQSVQFTVDATTTDGGTLIWQLREGTNCASSTTAVSISSSTDFTMNSTKSHSTWNSSTCYVVQVINTLNGVSSSVQSTYQFLPQYTSTPVSVNRTAEANNLSGKVGQVYSNSTPFSVSGGGGSWQYYFSNVVPAGLSINVNTGIISGTYTTVRDSYFGTFILAIDANGGTSNATVGPLTWSVTAGDALTPAFGTPTATADGFTVQISNYDSNFTWAGTASASGSVTISNTGLVTVTGVAVATSSTATITTTRSNYTSGSATVSATSQSNLTITFNRGANGTGSNQTLTKTFGTAVTLPNSTTANGYFTRTGYTISAWSTTDGGSQTHALAGSFTTDADTTLYPVWSPNTLTITFDSQSGSVVSNGTVATNATLTAPTPPTRAGYTFSGWSTTSSGSVVSFTGGYTHGQTANFTLYAIWSANALTITYDSKGGSSVTSGTVNTAASISSAPTAPTRAGYTFSAWSATDGGTAITFPYAHGQTANFILYALWTANSLTVTYDSKGGSSVTSGTVNTGASISSAPTAPTKTGYTLDGWSLTDGGTVVTFPFAHGQTANFTLYAKWTGTTNTITYDSKGGSSVANGSFVTGGNISSAPTAPTRAGYTLSGWSLTDGGSVITYPYTPTATSGITLYAIWTGVSCSPTSSTTGGYTIYTFTTAGTCFWTVPNGVTDVEVLAVAGGAGGGYSYDNSGAGGGGGGQVKTGTLTLSTTAEVTVGAGGAGGTVSSRRGGSGGNSSISTISALGGTGGCGSRSSCATASQATSSAAANGGAGGAGGASGRGGGGSNTTATAPTTATAGAGTASTYSGSSVTYGVGGAGGTARGNTTNIVGADASANSGNGGGGASAKSSSGDVNGGAGGTGLVIVRVASALTVSFDSQSGSAVSDTSTVTAGVLSEPTAPTRTNYTFLGWFTATSGGSAITFPYSHGQTANFTLYARWALNTYAIVFDKNHSLTNSGTMANQSVTHGVAANLNANLFTRPNYVFHRWAVNADGSGTTYNNLAQVTLTAGTTLYAQWTANTYVVTYSYNNATGGNSTATSSFTTGGTVIVLPTPTRTGYTFGGWYSDSGLSSSIGSAGANYSPTGTTLSLNAYAKWTAVDYTFTYDGNNSDGGTVPTETSKQITQTATVKANTGSLTRAGYTFVGWNTQSNGSGDNYLSGSLFTVQSSNVTLYAKWSPNSYTITYNSNGGTGSAQRSSNNVSSDTYTTGGSSVALPGVGTLERAGYTFDGWNTSAAGTGTNRSAGATYTTVSDVIFYAKWNPVTYSITYNGNTSDGGTTPTTGGYTTGQASPYSVLTNTFTKTLHVFGGWNTAANGSGTSYSPGSTITTLSNIVLYATWIPQFTLHYAINGGTVSSGSLPADQLYNANTSVGPVFSSVSRTGYTFGGWRNGSSTIAAGGSFTIVQDSVLTAIWTPIDYTISYDPDGGTTPPNSFTKQIGQSFEVGSAVTKPGYNFTGWKAGSTTVGAGATVVTGSSNISYTAQWVAKVYRISYDWNGGRGTAVSDVDYTFGTTAITLPLVGDRVKDGYNFAGWAESTNGSALGLTYIPSQTRTLYALWTLGNFTVTYDAGRGTVANSTVAVQNGSSTVLPLPTRANFVFDGWHSAVTGGTRIGNNGDSFTPAASRTIYARWIQSSLYGITDSLSRIGSVITTSNVSNTFSGANSNSSVSVSIPANALPAGTTINFDLVGNSSRAVGVLPNVSYLVSIALSWLTGDETVPDTASDKPITVTISNATIKAGAAAYAIVNNVSTLLGTATQDGTITISITADPEIVIAATKPGAPTNVSATSNGNQQSVISWSAPSSNGGSAITGYTVTANTGATCTSSGTSCTISNLTNGTAYTFTVTAANSVGPGVASSSASATTASLYAVAFDAKGGSTVSNGSFLTASTVSEPTAPTRVGYSFAGWAATDGGTVEVFPYAPGVTSNITMYAKWDALDNNVSFDAMGGSSVTASVFASGGTVAEPTAPTRSGYTFAGWSATDGGSTVTFPYAPGVVTDITLYAKWTAVSSSGGGGGGGSSNSNNSSSSGSSNAGGVNAPAKNNVTTVAPVTVVGNKEAKISTVEVSISGTGSSTKPPLIKIDGVSEKFIADFKVVEGKLALTPETGFSGKKTVTVTITENGADRVIQIPLTVLPEPVAKPVLTPTASNKSIIRWTESPNATAYTVLLNGKKVCATSASSCSVKQTLGPDAVIEVISNGGDRTVSEKIEADFRQNTPVAITRIVSATITKATLTRVDTKALDKVIALIKTQGFGTVVISEITTTKKTAILAAARVAAIKKYIDEKTGSRNLTFEIVPPASRTYFNNISVKG